MIQRLLVLLVTLALSSAALANLPPIDATQPGDSATLSPHAQLMTALEITGDHALSEPCEPHAELDGLLLAQGCCRVCRTGKACGNSCINRNYTCRQSPGCACNG